MTMNWSGWCYGVVVALLTSAITGLVAWGTLPMETTTKQIIVICVVPALSSFGAWLKQTPPPVK